MSCFPTVLIYCDDLLPYSATFIRSQAEALQHYRPYYVGVRRIAGLPLSEGKTVVVNTGSSLGKAREAAFKLWGTVTPRFRQELRSLYPSLIHAHFGPDGVRAMPIARNLGLPLIVSFHGYDVTVKEAIARQASLSHRMYLQRRAVLQRQGSQFIAVSDFIRRLLLEQGFPEDRVTVHYIGVDTTVFAPDPQVQRQPVVLFTGRLVEKKGCAHLIRAMAQVQEMRSDVELIMIGDGPLRQSLEEQAQASLKRYQFLGVQPPEAVKAWMNRAQVFCVPSVIAESGDAEAFGIVFAEAQAMGLPVVSFASGGIPEAVAHGKTGFLAPEQDVDQLAEYILRLLSEETLWESFSQSGQTWVRQNFDLKRQTQKLEDLYGQVLERSPQGRRGAVLAH